MNEKSDSECGMLGYVGFTVIDEIRRSNNGGHEDFYAEKRKEKNDERAENGEDR